MIRPTRPLGLLLAAAVIAAGCTATTAPTAVSAPTSGPSVPGESTSTTASPSASGSPTTSRLLDALAFLPAGSDSLMFTDWARLKRALGAESLTGASPFDQKIAMLQHLQKEQASPTGFGSNRYVGHYDFWGWDMLDLDWDAQWLAPDGPPAYVLRFREGIDLSKTLSQMDAAGFETRQKNGATIRSHSLDLKAGWATTTELAIANTAFLPDGRTLVLSSGAESVDRALDALQAGVPDVGTSTLARAIGDQTALVLLAGTDSCQGFRPDILNNVPPAVLAALRQQLGDAQLVPYDALAIGYDTVDGRPAGIAAFHFGDPNVAASQLAARERIATAALSVRTGRPYSQSVFMVRDRRVTDTIAILVVDPADGLARRLFDSVFARDALYAAC